MRVHGLILDSLAPSTRVSYFSKVREFACFCEELGLQVKWPVPVDILLRFMLHLFDRDLQPRSITIYLAALAFMAGLKGCEDVTTNFKVRKMMEGMRRSRPVVPDRRRPITAPILQGLLVAFDIVCVGSYEPILFRAVILVMFWGAFRVSEVVISSRLADPAWVIGWADISLSDAVCKILLRKSKTDQRARGFRVNLRALPGNPLCPVNALINYRRLVSCQAGPLFQHADGTPLTVFQLRSIFSLSIISMGLSSRHYNLHSLRIGAATLAASMGFPDDVIRRIGRWRSEAFRLYILK